jgi:hypothetical protein
MDGVLCDFEKQFYKLTGHTFDDSTYDQKSLWVDIEKGGIEFWSQMEWMRDGKQLWSYIKDYNPIILSAPTFKSSHIGKRIWVKRELGKHIECILDRNKYKYAEENNILIDDMMRNIKPWIKSGGIAIFHENTRTTISKLRRMDI